MTLYVPPEGLDLATAKGIFQAGRPDGPSGSSPAPSTGPSAETPLVRPVDGAGELPDGPSGRPA